MDREETSKNPLGGIFFQNSLFIIQHSYLFLPLSPFSFHLYTKFMSFLAQPLTKIKGIGFSIAQKLEKLDIRTVKDLLYHFPFRYQDFSTITPISDVQEGELAVIHGVLTKISIRKTWKRKMWLVEATIEDESGKIKAVWFNQKYLISILKEGMALNCAGKVTSDGKKLALSSPLYEIISHEGQLTRHTGRIVPVYPETRGVTSKMLRLVMSKIIEALEDVEEFLPDEVFEHHDFPNIKEAFARIHFPETLDQAQEALERFAFQDMFLLQLLKTHEKRQLTQKKSIPIPYDIHYVKSLLENLPFELTLSQKKALHETLQDLERPHATHRLLQGDVGSGKTIVAALAALCVAREKEQSVFMAPTEVLATQHYQTFKKLFPDFHYGVALLTSSQSVSFFGEGLETQPSKKELLQQIQSGKIKIVIGTHAVIQKNVSLGSPAFVVIDEQHRFGVRQRALLSDNAQDTSPHLLSMSATPIPRTLALTVFGDLDLSIISELPKNRKKIITKIVPPSQRAEAYQFVRKQIAEGRQAFVICPRIEPSDPTQEPLTFRQKANLEVKTVTEEYEKLSKKIFPDLRVAMLHGRLKPKEKQEIMGMFKDGEYDILVSTSVMEVGVDVPNASIMMIEGSEFFGLSQLYQFRGRVGRGEHQSYCFLLTNSRSATTTTRMKSLVNAKNGFELAEIDLRLRGPGQFLGSEQTGMPDLAMKALHNPELVSSAREEAVTLLEKDPSLTHHPYLKTYLSLFEKQIHLE